VVFLGGSRLAIVVVGREANLLQVRHGHEEAPFVRLELLPRGKCAARGAWNQDKLLGLWYRVVDSAGSSSLLLSCDQERGHDGCLLLLVHGDYPSDDVTGIPPLRVQGSEEAIGQEVVDLVIGEELGAIVEHVAQMACLIAIDKLVIGEEDGHLAERSLFMHGYAPFLTEVFPCALIHSGNRLD